MIDGKPFDWLATPELGRRDNSYQLLENLILE